MHNGVMLMGFAALVALWFTGGAGDDAAGDVFDQRVRHVFAVDDRHVPALVRTAAAKARSGGGGSPCFCSGRRCASAS